MRQVCFIFALIITAVSHADTEVFYRELAEYHAPVVFQETGSRPEFDAITNIDFDGDFNGLNNWNNANRFIMKSYVYYEVFETRDYYFVFYGFFHPRDYASICLPILCHENDFEGAMFFIQKTPSNLMGKVVLVETQAHSRFHTYRPRFIKWSMANGSHKRVALWVEKEGHGVYLLGGKKYMYPSICGNQNAKDYVNKRSHLNIKGESPPGHIVYSFSGRADIASDESTQALSYNLIEVSDSIWPQVNSKSIKTFATNFFYHFGTRFDVGSVPEAFVGRKYGKGLAKFPWGWPDLNCADVPLGDWFFDPALILSLRIGEESLVKNTYLRHKFLVKSR